MHMVSSWAYVHTDAFRTTSLSMVVEDMASTTQLAVLTPSLQVVVAGYTI